MMWWRKRWVRLPPTLEEQRKIKEARDAAADAKKALEQTKRQGAEVRKVAAVLRTLRTEDNFAALIEHSMARRP